MRLSYFDEEKITENLVKKEVKKLAAYRDKVAKILKEHDASAPEYALGYATEGSVTDTLTDLTKQFKGIKHLVLIGIGGSSLGTEAVHTALGEKKVQLTVFDTIAPFAIKEWEEELKKVKKASDIVVCIVSKSGTTVETLVNGSIVLDLLEKKFGLAVYAQCVMVGNKDTALSKFAKGKKATYIEMPESIGGRFSVATEVGLVPLALLGHDVDSFIAGVADASSLEIEDVTASDAGRLSLYIKKGYRHYNFFAFEKRLATLGAWYRQLHAESLGKAKTIDKKPYTKGMLPTITTPTELHSIGQLYLSNFPLVYTDFVTFDDMDNEHAVSKKGIGKEFSAFTDQEVVTALYAGVIGAYKEKKLPYRSIIFDEDNLSYSIGLFMAMRMREIMYTAHLLELNAFDQPNVELYKVKTKKVLDL